MKYLGRRRNFNILCIALMTIILLIGSIQGVRATDISLDVPLQQIFKEESKVPTGGDVFTYAVTQKSGETVTPVGGSTVTMTGNQTKNVTFKFNNTGVYTFSVKQSTPAKEGYTLDSEEYLIKFSINSVLDKTKNQCIVERQSDGTKSASLIYTNTYKPKETIPADVLGPDGKKNPLLVDPPVRKTVKGTPSKAGTFRFKLEAMEDGNPMPAGSENGVKYMTIKGEGSDDFGTWSYTKAGTYKYRVSEVKVDANGNDYEYDSTVYTITDIVEDQGGKLVQKRSVVNYQKQVNTFDFVNVYQGGSAVKTGDAATVLFFLIIAGGATIIFFAMKKKREQDAA